MTSRILAVLLATIVAGCATPEPPAASAAARAAASAPAAVAELKPTQGNTVSGTVRFEQQGKKVIVSADVAGLRANAEFGFHVHEKGDCSAADGMSAGAHFNPGGKPHGHYEQGERHAGDLPSLRSDANGRARQRWESDALAVGAGEASVIGRSVIVHRDPDDYKTQPTGNSGPRLACGVIAVAK